MGFFIPRHWRFPKVIWALLILEFPFTVANLALFGIAAPNLYRTILWQEGGMHGYNSDPSTVLYAAANHRPVKTPLVWSNFQTQFNLVVGVFSMFVLLTKFTMFTVHAFWPLLSLIVHLALVALWAVSIHAQTAPDTIDPKRANNGPPWYITKNCNVSSSTRIKGYCMQAKSAFAVSVVMLVLFATHAIIAAYSLRPTKEARIAHDQKVAEKKAEKELYESSPYDNEMTADEQWQHMWELQQLPRTPGTAGGMRSPMTPRTKAFNSLDGGQGHYAREPHQPVSPVAEEEHGQWYEGRGKGQGQAV
ncbi:uncharacterized protein BDR25DRAFT_252328 [Lindgomyces ingoldianus]|uniref:Uncharacterized protein n=1 Tax=Lindgomyces ingoldianus TaxID=673940 RepID=A0ACB6RAW2_9PLEO|nr:uncharacterized protein BDR25DRAFT_252328 [Lindgomyces ingoldianus]KAF2476379.1 hypothetical protein BDR25DRAFT_252328 [Lindgomyces ingoldianus]